MIVQSLEACLNALEEDCEKVICKGDEKAQDLKNGRHTLYVKAHHDQNKINNNKLEVKQKRI